MAQISGYLNATKRQVSPRLLRTADLREQSNELWGLREYVGIVISHFGGDRRCRLLGFGTILGTKAMGRRPGIVRL